MQEQLLAAAIQKAVEEWKKGTQLPQQLLELDDPAALSEKLATQVEQVLVDADVDMEAMRQEMLNAPYVHLKQVFIAADLPDTPVWFTPVPDADASAAGRAAALATHGFLHKETISYGSENDGALFVNLVPIPGDGTFAKKSVSSMRGHTDGVSFPFQGDVDADNPRIAPSPDLVTLVGLRNPNSVPTNVMPLTEVLKQLSPENIAELKKDQYTIIAQHTFKTGMREILGDIHYSVDEPVLKDAALGTIVRYSHSSVSPTDMKRSAKDASDSLEQACNNAVVSVVIAPGDVLLVSNRLCLHGRGEVGEGVGAQERWLLRTYALDTTNLEENRRHMNGRPTYVLYP
jgi:hypothetical protein